MRQVNRKLMVLLLVVLLSFSVSAAVLTVGGASSSFVDWIKGLFTGGLNIEDLFLPSLLLYFTLFMAIYYEGLFRLPLFGRRREVSRAGTAFAFAAAALTTFALFMIDDHKTMQQRLEHLLAPFGIWGAFALAAIIAFISYRAIKDSGLFDDKILTPMAITAAVALTFAGYLLGLGNLVGWGFLIMLIVMGVGAISAIANRGGTGPGPGPTPPPPPPPPPGTVPTISAVRPAYGVQGSGRMTIRVEGTNLSTPSSLYFPFAADPSAQPLNMVSSPTNFTSTSFELDVDMSRDHAGNPPQLGVYGVHFEDAAGNVIDMPNVFEIKPPGTPPPPIDPNWAWLMAAIQEIMRRLTGLEGQYDGKFREVLTILEDIKSKQFELSPEALQQIRAIVKGEIDGISQSIRDLLENLKVDVNVKLEEITNNFNTKIEQISTQIDSVAGNIHDQLKVILDEIKSLEERLVKLKDNVQEISKDLVRIQESIDKEWDYILNRVATRDSVQTVIEKINGLQELIQKRDDRDQQIKILIAQIANLEKTIIEKFAQIDGGLRQAQQQTQGDVIVSPTFNVSGGQGGAGGTGTGGTNTNTNTNTQNQTGGGKGPSRPPPPNGRKDGCIPAFTLKPANTKGYRVGETIEVNRTTGKEIAIKLRVYVACYNPPLKVVWERRNGRGPWTIIEENDIDSMGKSKTITKVVTLPGRAKSYDVRAMLYNSKGDSINKQEVHFAIV